MVTQYPTNELSAGCTAVQFTQPASPDFFRSQVAITLNKCSLPVKYHIIHDLFWPPQDSVNDHIDPEAFKCFYASFSDVVALGIKHGMGTLYTKLDLADAFKHILVRSQDWPALGLPWDHQLPDSIVVCLYYINFFLPFKLHSSLALFN